MTNLMRLFQRDDWLTPSFRDIWTPLFLDTDDQERLMPKINIRETQNAFILEADLPGIPEKDINLELKEGVLTISGERKEETSEDNGDYHRREIVYGSFHRRFSVGENINPKDIKANYKNGTLKVTLPKGEKEKAKTIKIDLA